MSDVSDALLPNEIDESEPPGLLPRPLDRAADGGATVIIRRGMPIGAIVSMKDYEVAENAIDEAPAARTYEDDGTRYTSDDVVGEDPEDDGR